MPYCFYRLIAGGDAIRDFTISVLAACLLWTLRGAITMPVPYVRVPQPGALWCLRWRERLDLDCMILPPERAFPLPIVPATWPSRTALNMPLPTTPSPTTCLHSDFHCRRIVLRWRWGVLGRAFHTAAWSVTPGWSTPQRRYRATITTYSTYPATNYWYPAGDTCYFYYDYSGDTCLLHWPLFWYGMYHSTYSYWRLLYQLLCWCLPFYLIHIQNWLMMYCS